ncbi:hypothetical protein DPEC_G00113810 [Dallia pectoralis]|uniref:Uncharacterized protein n=1 Tax=Dallia pectoralis TaxID=75939 RepID=A0ACC2GTU7_DALPE|nr:hypothetical protein DPEC_G00113810 [Dallia pectoralis]
MSASMQALCSSRYALVFLVFSRLDIILGYDGNTRTCPTPCTCAGDLLDCSRLKRRGIPESFPEWTVQLDLSHNKLQSLDSTLFRKLRHLSEIKLNNNEFESVPDFGLYAANITTLDLTSNRIARMSPEQLSPLQRLETLDLSYNNLLDIKAGSFPSLPLKTLIMNNNRISTLEANCFVNLSSTLHVLRLNRNRLSNLPVKIFQLPNLQHLELNRNRIRRVEGLTFQGLHALRSLKMQRNGITRLMDGAFWGLSNMEVLQLDYNNLTEVTKGWMYGLLTLQQLHLGHNSISRIQPDAWQFCQKLSELDLASNQLARLEESSFVGLNLLDDLHIGNNRVSFIADGAFRGLSHLQMLDLQNNEISWTIEDMNGPFSALDKLRKLFLQGNQIRSVTRKSFSGLDTLEHLSSDSPMTFAWKKDNEVLNNAEIHNQAHLRAQGGAQGSETEVTEYTTTLWLRSVAFASEGKYQCVISNHFGSSYSTKAKLIVNMLPSFTKIPMDLSIRAGATARLECAAVGHPSPQIAWQKDGGTDFPAARERRMHVMPEDDVFFIVDVKMEDIGVYNCTAQNTAGAISASAMLTVLETPSFLRPLMDRTVVKGETAVLQCIAGGSPLPRLNWTKDDSPLLVTERHFFAAANQLLIIVDAAEGDAGAYTCEMSNMLGTERGTVRLSVLPNPNCDSGLVGAGAGASGGVDEDGWTTVGIVIIAVVCCVVGTSLVWVVIIYHTRRRNENCSVTNTDETNLPADIPSYLSSQGTLADRQDAYVPSESSSGNHQFITSSMSGFYMQPKDMNSLCQLDTGSEADMEAAIDPLLCHYQGPIGALLMGGIYTGDLSDTFTGCAVDQRSVCNNPYDSLTSSRRRDYYPCGGGLQDPFDHGSPCVLVQMPSGAGCHGPSHLQGDGVSSTDEGEGKYGGPQETRLSSSNTFMGTFGKAPWRPQQDLYPGFGPAPLALHNGMMLHENPYAALETDSEREEDKNSIQSKDSDSQAEQSANNIYEHPYDINRTAPGRQARPST